MNNGEFYSAGEYNYISEYKHFPAETYRRVIEENPSGKEDADSGKEVTSLQPKAKRAKKSDGGMIERLFNSIRGAATATVAAASVLVTATTLGASAPRAELVSYECGDTYIEYEMSVSGLEDDGEYAIVLSTAGEEQIERRVDSDGSFSDRVEGLKPEWEYTLSLVQYDALLGEISHLEVKLQTVKHSVQEPIPPPIPKPKPVLTVTDAEIVGLNEVRIYFTADNLPKEGYAELNLLLGDLSTSVILLTDADVARGYTELRIDSSAALTVTPVITDTGDVVAERTECVAYTHTFDETLTVESMVGLYNDTVSFYPIGIACGAEYLHVTSSLDPDNPEILWLDDAVYIGYSTEDVITYTMYLTNDNGDVLSNEVSVTVDTGVSAPTVDYYVETPNPGDVVITYNDDGTVNMYIKTQFESANEDVYCQITVGGMRYFSRDKIVRIENIPDQSYALQYDVCIEIDGQIYSIFNTYPSGMVNEPYFYMDSDLAGNVLTLRLYKDSMHIDLSSVRIVSSVGEEILLNESEFVYNDEYGYHEAVVELTEYAEEVVVYMMANPYCDGLESIDGYIGNERKIFEETVYQP